ncbi:unnamed protein product [Moneuplotes crassus]|uniref:Uncharacterized protein n=1 Tax=Euplotes crassus TaxID=5936 RepID=A0AAD1Y2Z1_EUPCR|nr:unnamed protein product [Moneuplotes crassus]
MSAFNTNPFAAKKTTKHNQSNLSNTSNNRTPFPTRGNFEKQGTFHQIQMHSPMRDLMFEKSRSAQMSVQEMGSAQESLFEPENEGPLPPPAEFVMKRAEIQDQIKKNESEDNFEKENETILNEMKAMREESELIKNKFKERPKAAGEGKNKKRMRTQIKSKISAHSPSSRPQDHNIEKSELPLNLVLESKTQNDPFNCRKTSQNVNKPQKLSKPKKSKTSPPKSKPQVENINSTVKESKPKKTKKIQKRPQKSTKKVDKKSEQVDKERRMQDVEEQEPTKEVEEQPKELVEEADQILKEPDLEEQGKTQDIDIYDRNNEKKILKLYKDLVIDQLEDQRKNRIKMAGRRLVTSLSPQRCPVCTLQPPCNHFTPEALQKKNEEYQLAEAEKLKQKPKQIKKKNPHNKSKMDMKQLHGRQQVLTAHNKMRMFSKEDDRSRDQLSNNFRNTGFFSNPHTPGSQGERNKYFGARLNRSHYHNNPENSDFFPEVDASDNPKINNVKIRIQGKKQKIMWGNLNSSLPNAADKSKRNKSDFSMRDTRRHAKLLAKIEKYKEDKILQELKMIEVEKMKTAKMMRIRRIKEQKRKAYLDEQKNKLIDYHKRRLEQKVEEEKSKEIEKKKEQMKLHKSRRYFSIQKKRLIEYHQRKEVTESILGMNIQDSTKLELNNFSPLATPNNIVPINMKSNSKGSLKSSSRKSPNKTSSQAKIEIPKLPIKEIQKNDPNESVPKKSIEEAKDNIEK